MTTRVTHTITTITAAAILLTAITTNASARNLSTTEQSFRVSWASLEFSALIVLRCRLTLEGSFHSRTIPKVERLLIGAITKAIFAHPCTGGEAWADNGVERETLGTAPNKLPFHLTYENFTGRLPAITALGLLLSRFSFVIRVAALGRTTQCRYGNATDNISESAALDGGGGITSIRPVEGRNTVTLVEGLGPDAICPASGRFLGTSGPVTGLTVTRTVSIRLI